MPWGTGLKDFFLFFKVEYSEDTTELHKIHPKSGMNGKRIKKLTGFQPRLFRKKRFVLNF